ncbi:MAG: ABC transporter ATP-binding protein [Oscillospiraceae bacterium]|jgi:putative ABC transport system ATP-binding protein|nr:ABC transporter ATP-binding protein [Oscillospiraceae bacterium]
MNIISIRDIRKVYHIGTEKVVALGRISLSVAQGEICCILGTSGSGKSTLLNIMAGLERPSRGNVVIGGTDVTRYNEKQWALFRQKNIGFIFQSYDLLPTMTALENVAMPLAFRGMDKEIRTRKAVKMLRAVRLGNRMLHRPTQMSGGQQQRVGIARAFVARPRLIFADEPTGNLDSKTGREVMELMVSMARKYRETLIIVTHDPEIAKYAGRVIKIHDGSKISDERNTEAMGTKEES